MKEKNNGYFIILIVAVAIVVSASFANNYFAYYFWTKDKGISTSNNSKEVGKRPPPSRLEIDSSWKWNYSEIGTKENNYPIVVLKDGYKAIKLVDQKVLVGWKYELLNTSPSTNYTVSIEYKFNDKDDFLIKESSGSENVPKQQIRTIMNTTWISYEDFKRISGSSWSVSLTPGWGDKKLKGNRFERAGNILKDKAPYWFKGRLQYLFISDFPSGNDKKGFWQVLSPNKWVIAQAMGIKPDLKLKDVGDKLNIDFTKYNLPNWNSISSNPNYTTLTKEEKQVLKTFLRVQKEYGDYSPKSGRISNFTWKEDFPDPKKTSQN
jgi:hypothetical protein